MAIAGRSPARSTVSPSPNRTVLIADYKSDRAVPNRVEDIPQGHIGQLALYRAVLRLLYPNHEVRAALVWTLGPVLMEVPAALLDAELSRLGTRKNTEA